MRAGWILLLAIASSGCNGVYFAKKLSLTPEKGDVSSLKIIDAPRLLVNNKTCSGHINEDSLYSGKPEYQVLDAEVSFVRLPRRLDIKNNLATVREAINSPSAVTASLRVTGELDYAPARADMHNQVVPLSTAVRERLSTELRVESPNTEMRIICHGKTSTKEFATFCDGVVVPNTKEGRLASGDVFVAQMRTNFHSWTQTRCVSDDGDFCDNECDQRVDPLVLDTSGNGLAVSNVGAVKFDINNIGYKQDMAWTKANTDDAFLVRDLNHDGRITNGSELFGTSTVLVDEYFGANGFRTLADADLNHDGVINSSDAIFSTLLLWFDKNANAISEPGELKPVSDYLSSVSLSITEVNREIGNNNLIYATADVVMNGSSTPKPFLIDIWFDARPVPNLTGR